jgi:hypothetical protein
MRGHLLEKKKKTPITHSHIIKTLLHKNTKQLPD